MSYQEHRFTSHDGLSLYYREYGASEDVVVCLPGLTRNCKDFEQLAEHLAARYRVITPDLRGRGQSDRDPKWKRYLPPTYVRDMWTLLDGLNIDRAVIIGTSLGGLMAMIMADQQPQRLRGVVLNDVGPEVPPEAIARILQYAGRTPAQEDWEAATSLAKQNYAVAYPNADDDFWAVQARMAWAEQADGTVTPDYDPKIGDALRQASRAGGLIRFLQRIGIRRIKGVNLDPWENFKAMDMPVLVIRGGISDILPPETIAAMKEIKPDLVVCEVPDRGHAPTLDEPEARAAIDQFLTGLSS